MKTDEDEEQLKSWIQSSLLCSMKMGKLCSMKTDEDEGRLKSWIQSSLLCSMKEKERKRKYYTLRRHLNVKPSVILGCPMQHEYDY